MKTNVTKLIEMVDRVVEREGIERPPIRWHFREAKYTTGTTWHKRNRGIALTLGTDHLEARVVTLHEIAHWMTPKHHHDAEFWRVAFWLYRCEGIGWDTIHRVECRAKTAHKVHRALVEAEQ